MMMSVVGTGKTLTAIKLVYWYVQINRKSAVGESRGQVLYCGPSNSSVDVAASTLHYSTQSNVLDCLNSLHVLSDQCSIDCIL